MSNLVIVYNIELDQHWVIDPFNGSVVGKFDRRDDAQRFVDRCF